MTAARSHQPMTIADVPFHFARFPTLAAKVAVSSEDDSRTWAQIAKRTGQLANALHAAGLEPGDKVATLLPNCVEYVEIMYGIAAAGCVIVPLNSRYVAREVEYAIGFSDARIVLTTETLARLVPAGIPTWIVGGEDETTSYERVLAGYSEMRPEREVDDDSVYWMPFTSGTTASPKAALVTHRALLDHQNMVLRSFELRASDVMLVAGPFYHSLGFLFGLTGLYAGGRIVIHRQFDPKLVLSAIESEQVTLTPMVPTMYTMLLAEDTAAHDLSSMRAVISAGSPLLTGTRDSLLEAFPGAGLYEFYGSTEVGIATILDPADQLRKTRCVGLPPVGVQVRVVGEDGRPVAPGEAGEVQKRGLLVGREYYKNDEATAAMYQDGWARTGDLGTLDSEGYLYIVDRKKDMIVTGGANVFPAEIEEVLAKHPAVLEVAVIGVPDEKWGEAIKAVVVLRPGRSVAAEELIELCGEQLAGYKKPRSVDFVDEMPKTGSGKLLKRELRDQYWATESARVR